MSDASAAKRYLYIVPLFIFSWISTFGAAFLNGDDIVHFGLGFNHDVYIPILERSWTPNRIFDVYFRTLIAKFFDFLYFPLHSVFNLDFFWFYKIYTATIFAVFLSLAYLYILKHASSASVEKNDSKFTLVINICLAMAVIMIFPWKNQVHMISYEIPAFLSFVFLNEFAKIWLRHARDELTPANSNPSVLLLAYLCAFSLEAYTATILISVVATWLLILFAKKYRSNNKKIRMIYERATNDFKLIYLSLVTLALSLISMVLVVFYSVRAHMDSNKFSLVAMDFTQLRQASFLRMVGSGQGLFIIGLFGLGFWLYSLSKKINKNFAIKTDSTIAFEIQSQKIITAIICFSCFVSTALVSASSGHNYFTYEDYPWGGLLIPAELYLVYSVALILPKLKPSSWLLRNALVLVAFIICSKYAKMYFVESQDVAQASIQVEKSYAKALKKDTSLVETGLNLEQIPMGIRPLPTANSPDWFIKCYRDMFVKYYGISDMPMFN